MATVLSYEETSSIMSQYSPDFRLILIGYSDLIMQLFIQLHDHSAAIARISTAEEPSSPVYYPTTPPEETNSDIFRADVQRFHQWSEGISKKLLDKRASSISEFITKFKQEAREYLAIAQFPFPDALKVIEQDVRAGSQITTMSQRLEQICKHLLDLILCKVFKGTREQHVVMALNTIRQNIIPRNGIVCQDKSILSVDENEECLHTVNMPFWDLVFTQLNTTIIEEHIGTDPPDPMQLVAFMEHVYFQLPTSSGVEMADNEKLFRFFMYKKIAHLFKYW